RQNGPGPSVTRRRGSNGAPPHLFRSRSLARPSGCGDSGRMNVRALAVLAAAVAAIAAGCGGDSQSTGAEPPLLTFGYDASRPLGYVDRGRVGQRYLEIHDVSFRSGR